MGDKTRRVAFHHKTFRHIYAFGISWGFARLWREYPCFVLKVQFMRHTWCLRIGLKGLP